MSASHENNRFYGDEDRYIGYIGKAVEKALNEGRITRDDADLLAEFVTEVSATQHVSPKRLHKLHYILINWREFIGPFRENNISRCTRASKPCVDTWPIRETESNTHFSVIAEQVSFHPGRVDV